MARTVNFKTITVTVSTAGDAAQISASRIFASDFEVYVKSGNTGAAMYVGDSTVDNTWIPRVRGGTFGFTQGDGDIGRSLAFDLSKIYVDADSNGDECIVQYRAFSD